MSEKFGNLGYELLDLDSLIYLGLDPDPTQDDPCGGQSCKGGCTPTCITCFNGGSTGG